MSTMHPTIDPAYLAKVVREVIARLREIALANTQTNSTQQNSTQQNSTQQNNTAVSISDKVITASTIEHVMGSHDQLLVGSKAIVTPAAKDAAKERGIEIIRGGEAQTKPNTKSDTGITQSGTTQSGTTDNGIIDTQQPERAAAIAAQLSRRSVCTSGLQIVLSETPATDVFCYCSDGKRTVMVTNVADIARFAAELNPTVWVLDMKRLNFMAAVNAAAAIARI